MKLIALFHFVAVVSIGCLSGYCIRAGAPWWCIPAIGVVWFCAFTAGSVGGYQFGKDMARRMQK